MQKVTAQLQLQSQLITLQSTVIDLLQEALVTGRPPDLHKLYNTSEFARDGVVRALCDQYKRMLAGAVPSPVRRRPVGPVRRVSSTPSLGLIQDRDEHGRDGERRSVVSSSTSTSTSRRTQPRHRKPKALIMHEHDCKQATALFCPFATSLQNFPTTPLASVLTTNPRSTSSHPPLDTCPTCHTVILSPASAKSQSWRIDKDVIIDEKYDKGSGELVSVTERRTYRVDNRFIVKCHRDGREKDGRYACYLCFCYRGRDTICRDEERLVAHVSEGHEVGEYERDGDIVEVR